MKIELTKKEEKKITVDVKFPIYREHDCSGDDYDAVHYTRINEDLTAVTICKSHHFGSGEVHYEFEFKDRYNFGESDFDYHLGRGKFESSAKQFYKILAEAKGRIAAIPCQDS